ncbi:hypothetical protein [uncultured Porphyromonas sp.]|uniref:hypothetical protein n=1 Tax=uncultured Porphyromonas sp. TaxID=159274 RepID=UPI0025E372EC|nr:hypothetical protein [uncultured Porphyromonas sp.]
MSKTKEQIIIPARDYEKYKRWAEICQMYDKMRKEQPERSKNSIHTYIGAQFGVSIASVIHAISRCTETTAVTLTRE